MSESKDALKWKLVEEVAKAMILDMFAPHELPVDDELWWRYVGTAIAAIAAISAAGFSIVGPEVTEDQIIDGYMDSGIDYQMSHDDIRLLFSAMLACADLARKPE